jgi:hypothetical protein
VGREGAGILGLTESEFVCRFEGGAADPADDGGTVSAGERVVDGARAGGAPERGLRFRAAWLWVWRL